MQTDSYEAIVKALAERGLVGQMQNEEMLVVSSQAGLVWPNRGNSFWLSRKFGAWYLSTWMSAGYRIPTRHGVVELALACMIGSSAMYRVAPEVVEQFELQELDEQEYERLFACD